MTRPCPLWLTRTCLAVMAAVPLTAQFEASAVIRYSAEEVALGFVPHAMNNRGWIVGANSVVRTRPMRYRPGVGNEILTDLGGRLLDINDAGTAVGFFVRHEENAAILRPAGASWKVIGHPGMANAINEAGQVVGSFVTDSDEWRPFIYTEAAGRSILFDQPAEPAGINEAGQVTGTMAGNRAFLWDPTEGLIDIQSRAGLPGAFTPIGIAEDGTVAGTYRPEPDSPRRLTTFSLASGVRFTGPANRSVIAQAVNGRGWIVGYRPAAFLYVYGQGMQDLDTLLVSPVSGGLVRAYDINDRDEIIAASSAGKYYILRRVRE